MWFELQGIVALHASAVVVNQRAVGFVSGSGNGKSTLAASFVQAGYSLLTDDILAIKREPPGFVALPGYPRVRLWENEASHFLGRYRDLQLVHPKISKRWVPIGTDGLGTFCDASQRLGCLYLPERRNAKNDDRRIVIEPISPRDALIALVRLSFAARTVEAIGLQKWRLDALAHLARQIPIRRIVYPSGFDYLPRVREAIIKDCET
jgi:hypothetical protein